MNEQSMKKGALTVYAPASSGNLSVGFDALGLALAPVDGSLLGDVVSIMHGHPDDWMLCMDGSFAHALPQDQEQNIVIASCRRFEEVAREAGANIYPLNITLDKNLPVGSGLGSSASSIVAILVALNQFFGRPLDRPALLQLMADMEGSISGEVHMDNIAPCLLGGLRLCISSAARQYGLPWPGHWQTVVAWPGTRLETKAARGVLPVGYARKTVVTHGAKFALFVHELHQGEAAGAAKCMVDLLAEPYRRSLLPGFGDARFELAQIGALVIGISGSGPSIFCITDDSKVATEAAGWLQQNYLQNESGFVRICRADLAGARVI